MTDESPRSQSPIDGAPVWVRAVQAAGVGMAAGLALHLLLSLVVLQGRAAPARPPAPAECKKSSPARESGGTGHRATPSVSTSAHTPSARG